MPRLTNSSGTPGGYFGHHVDGGPTEGYPSTTYAHGVKQGMPKRTNPTNQAPKWFSQALVKAISTTDGEGTPEVAIAFPDYPRFRSLIAKSEWALRRLGIGVYLVREDGAVERLIDHA